MMRLNVYYPYIEVGDEAYQILTGALDEVIELTVGATRPDPAEYHILVEGRPSAENLTASPNLHTLLIPWAGLPNITRDTLRDYPHIAVHNIHHNAVITAEMMMAMLLSAAKFIIPIDRKFREHNWSVRYGENPSVMLEGKTALILGYGSIGQRLARMCQGFGMRVIATKRRPEKSDDVVNELYPPSALHDLLPQANFLLICLPHTDETDGLLGADELNLLPEYAVVVNAGRGRIIEEKAFYEALKTGKIYAAGSDVWYTYPLSDEEAGHTPPSPYPFHELDNLVMSPHRAGGSIETAERRMLAIAEMLNWAARGQDLPHRIDLDAGY